jgi:hypothetical protein
MTQMAPSVTPTPWRDLAFNRRWGNFTTAKANAEMKSRLCSEKYPEKFAGKYL